MLGNRYSQHSFAQTPATNTPRSQFDRSHTVKDTMDFDYLTPIFVDEVYPGDTFNLTLKTFARLSSFALKNPVMDNMFIDFEFFFVPNRLVWANWEKFMGAQDNPDDSTDFLIPTITSPVGGYAVGSIYDHFGLPTEIAGFEHSALPFRCYYLIRNTWYRDQNLMDSLVVPTDDGPDLPADYELQLSCKKHDYFTSLLPWPQKGEAVTLPLGSTAPVIGIGKLNNAYGATGILVNESDSTTTTYADSAQINASAGDNSLFFVERKGATIYPNIRADLSAATAATINQFRQAIAVQSLLELDARGGTRYVEIILAHFNTISPDFRLQRPEYLGGGHQRINSNVVPQTSATSGNNALGQVAAYGTSASNDNSIGFTKSFVEHGWVIGIARARADITYQQGLNRMWSRSTKLDFFWPKLQEIGEQAVPLKEIYTQGTVDDDDVLGYIPRYDEMRFKPSEIRGQFRSTYATSLDSWHMAQEFASAPELNEDFIVSSTPIERALAITTGPHLLMDMWFQYKCARPMATYAIPSTLGRF